jgi:hypothetical protein
MATRSTDQNNLIKLYLAAFLRAPEYSGYVYWADQLSAGKTIQQVSWTMFNLDVVLAIYPDSISSTEFVNRIYHNVFGKAGDADGIVYWRNRLYEGSTRGELVLDMINAGLNTPDSTPGKAYIANRYTAAQYAVEQQQALSGEITPDALLAAMTTVTQSPQTLANYSIEIRQLALAAAGKGFTYYSDTFNESTLNDGSIAETIAIRLSGDTFKGSAGDKLGTVSKVPAGLTATLTKTSDVTALLALTGKASAHTDANSIANLTVVFTGTDLGSGSTANLAGATRNDLTVVFHDLFIDETSGSISGVGAIPGALTIDLASDKMTLGGNAKLLNSGSIANAHNIDLANMGPPPSTDAKTPAVKTTTTVSAVLQGDNLSNNLAASAYGDTLEGRGGNDVLKGGAGTDRFIFADSASNNGLDTITGFTLGASGDVLNFKAFLDKTGTGNIATLVAPDPATTVVASPRAWVNGDVLVAQGNWLNTAADIANLFGAGHIYAAPTVATKAVLITTDIVGNAKVWYITNQSDLTHLTADEIQQVATLENIHNLTLVGFVAANFA